jgi:hypothetical protein
VTEKYVSKVFMTTLLSGAGDVRSLAAVVRSYATWAIATISSKAVLTICALRPEQVTGSMLILGGGTQLPLLASSRRVVERNSELKDNMEETVKSSE